MDGRVGKRWGGCSERVLLVRGEAGARHAVSGLARNDAEDACRTAVAAATRSALAGSGREGLAMKEVVIYAMCLHGNPGPGGGRGRAARAREDYLAASTHDQQPQGVTAVIDGDGQPASAEPGDDYTTAKVKNGLPAGLRGRCAVDHRGQEAGEEFDLGNDWTPERPEHAVAGAGVRDMRRPCKDAPINSPIRGVDSVWSETSRHALGGLTTFVGCAGPYKDIVEEFA